MNLQLSEQIRRVSLDAARKSSDEETAPHATGLGFTPSHGLTSSEVEDSTYRDCFVYHSACCLRACRSGI